jgi:UDP-N-acetyl-D-galactosamine dehydrogenase
MGITFKENVSDIRNSKVADLVKELMSFSINVHIVDPYASPNEVAHEYGLTLMDKPSDDYDAVIVSVGHDTYKSLDVSYFSSIMNGRPVLMDLKGMYKNTDEKITYWRL